MLQRAQIVLGERVDHSLDLGAPPCGRLDQTGRGRLGQQGEPARLLAQGPGQDACAEAQQRFLGSAPELVDGWFSAGVRCGCD
jgi:hypothetical protein